MTNILEAIHNIIHYQEFRIKALYAGRNSVNNMGEALEKYIKDAFADTFNLIDEKKKLQIYNQKFSWLGNQNHPPDIMIKGGDAIEVKKIQSAKSDLALNSSYPKSNLSSSSPMITKECKNCENWTTKDLIYCVGHTSDHTLHSLWFVYGSIYAAKHATYQKIKNTISSGIKTIPDIEIAQTKELGRINRVDPLGITNLRIRGMWQIQNPRKVFDYLHPTTEKTFELVCVIPTNKYKTFPLESQMKIENLIINGFSVSDVKVKNPNNPADLIDCKFVKFCI